MALWLNTELLWIWLTLATKMRLWLGAEMNDWVVSLACTNPVMSSMHWLQKVTICTIVISCLATDGFLVFDLLRVLLTNHVWADFDSMQVNVPSKDKKKGEKNAILQPLTIFY